MSDRLLKVRECAHKERVLVFSSGEDAPGKSRDTCEQCSTCGAVIHDYRHGGGQTSPNYPMVRESPLLKPFLAVCQQLIEAERALNVRGMSCTPDLDMMRLAKENERLRLDLDVAESRKSEAFHRLRDDGDRMRLALHDLAFAAPTVGDEHRNAKGWLAPEAWGAYVSRVQKLASGAIRRPPTDVDTWAVSAQAKTLLTDVDAMMDVLRCVASAEYTREEVREQAAGALERLKKRGIGAQ